MKILYSKKFWCTILCILWYQISNKIYFLYIIPKMNAILILTIRANFEINAICYEYSNKMQKILCSTILMYINYFHSLELQRVCQERTSLSFLFILSNSMTWSQLFEETQRKEFPLNSLCVCRSFKKYAEFAENLLKFVA